MILLKKPPMSRKINEIKILEKATENVNFFQTTGKESHEQCMRHMTFVEMSKGTMVFETGIYTISTFINLIDRHMGC